MRTSVGKSTRITATKEDYIRAIYILSQSPEGVGVTGIASKLKLSKSTVSERLKELVRDGLVVADPYAAVTLTEKGLDIGIKLTYKHRIIEVFLHQTLKMKKDLVHSEAERLEHACSDEVIQRLAKFLHDPESDPHGSAIPEIKNWNLNKS
ncbi:MAG TPA: metal-dependent transcriptional regulator [Candidatus Paceibacterota bacterium]|nr:metal-dependent transcriptional regulator [Candidatus Paceibacterota bacterium]HMO82588.1 metal-dependent transcriptional regulator [Candidatus Paceibacterota bacterium]